MMEINVSVLAAGIITVKILSLRFNKASMDTLASSTLPSFFFTPPTRVKFHQFQLQHQVMLNVHYEHILSVAIVESNS